MVLVVLAEQFEIEVEYAIVDIFVNLLCAISEGFDKNAFVKIFDAVAVTDAQTLFINDSDGEAGLSSEVPLYGGHSEILTVEGVTARAAAGHNTFALHTCWR